MKRSFIFKMFEMLILPTLLTFVYGCIYYYVPKEYPVSAGKLRDFSSHNTVAVINDYTSGKVEVLGTQAAQKWMGDLRLWTDTAVRVLEKALQTRGITVKEGAHKQLKLAITRVNLYWGFAAIRCILTLRVDTAEGYSKEFEGNNASPLTLYRACDGAITKSIEAMLDDEKILQYLKY